MQLARAVAGHVCDLQERVDAVGLERSPIRVHVPDVDDAVPGVVGVHDHPFSDRRDHLGVLILELVPHWLGQPDPLKLGNYLATDSPYDRVLHPVRVYRGLPSSTRDPTGMPHVAARRPPGSIGDGGRYNTKSPVLGRR